MEREKAEKLVIAALNDNETNGPPHQELEAKAQESEATARTDSVRVCGEIPKGDKSNEVDEKVVVNFTC